MQFESTPIKDVYVIEPTTIADERGWFARVFCARTFRDRGMVDTFVQTNHSRSEHVGTIRGLHYQLAPSAEVKLVRCTRGEVFDVCIDVRRGSPTFLQWFGTNLSEDNRRMMYVPCGFAHGYQALTPRCEITYQSSAEYAPEDERQIRCDDPAVGIDWPEKKFILSPKDASIALITDRFQGIVLSKSNNEDPQ